MKYKTIALELIQQRPVLCERLRRDRTLFSTMERLALELKTRHRELQTQLAQAAPDRAPTFLPIEAMELAVRELEEALPDE
jgi:hypothetical protein